MPPYREGESELGKGWVKVSAEYMHVCQQALVQRLCRSGGPQFVPGGNSVHMNPLQLSFGKHKGVSPLQEKADAQQVCKLL